MKRAIFTDLAAVAARRRLYAARLLVWPAAVAATLISVAMVSPLAADTTPDIAGLARDLPRSLSLQTELPLLEPLESHLPLDTRLLLWAVVVIGACVLAYCLYEILPPFGARRAGWDEIGEDGDGGLAGRGGDDPVRAAADELAQQGRFVEAMHVLLLQGLDEMRTRLDLRFADSLTSREIVSRANAPSDAKTALRDIIGWVERAYFGDHAVDRSDYDACRRSYVALDSTLRAGSRT